MILLNILSASEYFHLEGFVKQLLGISLFRNLQWTLTGACLFFPWLHHMNLHSVSPACSPWCCCSLFEVQPCLLWAWLLLRFCAICLLFWKKTWIPNLYVRSLCKISVTVAPKLTFFAHSMPLSFASMETVHTIDPSCALGTFSTLYWEGQAAASCNV